MIRQLACEGSEAAGRRVGAAQRTATVAREGPQQRADGDRAEAVFVAHQAREDGARPELLLIPRVHAGQKRPDHPRDDLPAEPAPDELGHRLLVPAVAADQRLGQHAQLGARREQRRGDERRRREGYGQQRTIAQHEAQPAGGLRPLQLVLEAPLLEEGPHRRLHQGRVRTPLDHVAVHVIGAHHAAGAIRRVDQRDLAARRLELECRRETCDARAGHDRVDPCGAPAHAVFRRLIPSC